MAALRPTSRLLSEIMITIRGAQTVCCCVSVSEMGEGVNERVKSLICISNTDLLQPVRMCNLSTVVVITDLHLDK